MNISPFNQFLQWTGAIFISLGHLLNTLSIVYHKDFWNILAFGIGAVAFCTWSIRVRNRPQTIVNIVSLITIGAGLVRALG